MSVLSVLYDVSCRHSFYLAVEREVLAVANGRNLVSDFLPTRNPVKAVVKIGQPIRRATMLPSRPRMAVDTMDGAQNLYEADHRIFLDVTQADIDAAICDDPKRCVAANAAIRMLGAIAVDFHRTVAYIGWPAGRGPFKALGTNYVVRYTMPSETMRQVAAFDRGGEVVPCQLDFQAVTDGRTLMYRRMSVRRSRSKGKEIRSKSTAGPRGGHHYVTGFIGTRID
jgi:hypothetical protein